MEYHGLKIFWTITVIGGIINILIILAVALLVGGLSRLHESFGNFTTQHRTQKDINKLYQDRASINSSLQYFTVAISVSVIASIIAMVLVFVIKDRFKALGIVPRHNYTDSDFRFCYSWFWYVHSRRYCRIKVQAKAFNGVDEMTI